VTEEGDGRLGTADLRSSFVVVCGRFGVPWVLWEETATLFTWWGGARLMLPSSAGDVADGDLVCEGGVHGWPR